MIQVLKRSDQILSVIAEVGRISLKDITEKCALNKTTAHNILKTLLHMKFISKDEAGLYLLGERFLSIAKKTLDSQSLAGISRSIAVELAGETCESGLVTIVRNNELLVIAKDIFDQALIVSSSVNNTLNRQGSASGRVFAAFLEGKDKENFIAEFYTDQSEAKRAESIKELEKDISQIKKNGICTRLIYQREVYALAVPVFDSNKKICAALGVNIPVIRFNKEKHKDIEQTMKAISRRMSELLKVNSPLLPVPA